jgi:hypothetical protein
MNKTELETMDQSFNGEPFVNVTADDTVDTKTMDFSFNAEPFYGVVNTTTPSGFVPKVIFF